MREKLKFPSGTATALMIGVLHGGEKTGVEGEVEEHAKRDGKGARRRRNRGDEESEALIRDEERRRSGESEAEECGHERKDMQKDWQAQIRLLSYSFGVSGVYVRTLSPSHSNLNDYLLMATRRPSHHTSYLNSTASPSSAPI